MPAVRGLNDLPIMSDAALKSIEDLLKAVNDASGSARALFVTLMVLALYFLIVVSGTDDMALLRNATVAVPTLSNATLPARAFYICAPLVFVFLHLDLLIHLKLLSDKLFRFNQLLETSVLDEQAVRDYRLRLAGFPFSNWLGSDPRTGRMAHALQGAMVWLTLVLLPLTVLMAMQMGFLAYQSEAVTWLHRVALIIDAGLLLYFWVAFRYGRYRPADAASSPLRDGMGECLSGKIHEFYKRYLEANRARQYRWRFSIIGRLMRGLERVWAEMVQSVFALAMLLALALLVMQLFAFVVDQRIFAFAALASGSVLFFAWLMPLFPALFGALRQSAGDIALGAWTFASRRWPVLMPAAPLLLLSLTVATIPDEAADRTSQWLYSWMEGRMQDNPSPDGGLTSSDFQRQIGIVRASLSENGKSKDAELREELVGARCARWLAATMPGMPDAEVRLSETEREGSALAFHLENTSRMPRNMRASCPTIALFHLKGGWFRRTLTVTGKVVARSDVKPELAKDLRASLRDYRARADRGESPAVELVNKYEDLVAQIEGLDLSERSLRWADFAGSAFPKALLDRAQLQHATLDVSDLRGVNFRQAWLIGANMAYATLNRADMTGTTLTGAFMKGASLTGVFMRGASLTGANMEDATLIGAIMGCRYISTKFQCAESDDYSRGATLTGANMRNAMLTGADMKGAALIGADMSGAALIGADMRGATLTGADMAGATLIGAFMSGATARGAIFSYQTDDLRGLVIGGLETGSFSEQDIESTVVELSIASVLFHGTPHKVLSDALDRLKWRINEQTTPIQFTNCIGGAPCRDDDIHQRQTALDRAAYFEALICGSDVRDGGGAKDFGSGATALFELLRGDLYFDNKVWFSDSLGTAAGKSLFLAARDALRRIESRRCGSPEMQALIARWNAQNPSMVKDILP